MNIAIIPARAGSKSIINKNLIKLDNKESITERACRLAMQSHIFKEVVLTTDIETLWKDLENKVTIIKRAQELCQDDSVMLDVICDVISQRAYNVDDWIWLLQPPSPFRRIEDFKNIKNVLDSSEYKSVISVNEVGAVHPSRMYTIHRTKMFPLRRTNFFNKQDLNPIYLRNGCFYVFKVGDFLKEKSFYIESCFGYRMSNFNSVNIDGPEDLLIAKARIKNNE